MRLLGFINLQGMRTRRLLVRTMVLLVGVGAVLVDRTLLLLVLLLVVQIGSGFGRLGLGLGSLGDVLVKGGRRRFLLLVLGLGGFGRHGGWLGVVVLREGLDGGRGLGSWRRGRESRDGVLEGELEGRELARGKCEWAILEKSGVKIDVGQKLLHRSIYTPRQKI